MTIIKVEWGKAITFSWLFVSQYNHINAKKVVKGIDIIIPAKNDERLATSEATTTTIAVIKVFITSHFQNEPCFVEKTRSESEKWTD